MDPWMFALPDWNEIDAAIPASGFWLLTGTKFPLRSAQRAEGAHERRAGFLLALSLLED
jgi:hypothetical protein